MFISPGLSPPKPSMRFFKIILWDLKDRGGIGIFKSIRWEELDSCLNSTGELWRSINSYGGNFATERKSSCISVRYTDSTF
jgi:hypothetical protein